MLPQGAPKGRYPDNKLTHLDTFWVSFFINFPFFRKTKRFLESVCFFVYLWAALGAPQRGLTCNPYAPVQSKRTLRFSFFFWKQLPKESTLGSFFGTIFIEILILCEKKGCKKTGRKNCPTNRKLGTIILSQGSLTAPLACALFQEETTVRAKVSGIVARAPFFQKSVVWFRFHSKFSENLFKKKWNRWNFKNTDTP